MVDFELKYASETIFVGLILIMILTFTQTETLIGKLRFLLICPFLLGLIFYAFGYPYWLLFLQTGLIGLLIALIITPDD